MSPYRKVVFAYRRKSAKFQLRTSRNVAEEESQRSEGRDPRSSGVPQVANRICYEVIESRFTRRK